MRKTVRLTERDLSRIVRRTIMEMDGDMDMDMGMDSDRVNGMKPQMDMEVEEMEGDVNRVMDFAYEMMNNYAPKGPRDKRAYSTAINQLQQDFNYAIRNLKGNINSEM